MERWVDIIGFDNEYKVSDLGRIKSIKSGLIMKLNKKSNGYVTIKLSKNGKAFHFLVHRLVASNFIENIDNKPQVNHLNKIRDDNRLVNLEWCTLSENSKHSHKTSKPPIPKNRNKNYINQFNLNKDEVWYKIKDSKYHYISNMGNVKSFCLKTKQEYYRKMNKSVYYSLTIDKKIFMTHRLVAIYFIPNNYPDKNIVNHINGDKYDNRASNLEWCTLSENTQKYIDSNINSIKRGEDCTYSKLNEEIVTKIYYDSSKNKEISLMYGISPQTVCDIKYGRSWKHVTSKL